ncbi:hypothetical protein RND81_07G089700 [Saponaria officinalis]|uniref:Pentatricopeptide repeat-containing protein n=1 Tax=Saponaria officinalis TaxID=3572 RepID=A0AAW1JPN1_SAPOF
MSSSSIKIVQQKIPSFPQTLIYKFISSTIQPMNHFPSNKPSALLEYNPENPKNKAENLLLNCTNLHHLRQLHAFIIRTHYLESTNGAFYWNNIIRSYTRLNSPRYALHVYLFMFKFRVSQDNYTLPIIIKAVGQICNLRIAQQFHGVAIRFGLESDEFVESGLINLYAKMGDFGNACKVFDESPERRLGSWNAMISALGQNGRLNEVLGTFSRMRRVGIGPDGVTMVSVNSVCGGLGDLKLAQQLHKFVFQVKVNRNEDLLSMFNSVIDMYGKCGRMDLANRVFNEMLERNVSSWTSMIVGYANHGQANEAMECFRAMVEANVMPNHVTFVGVLSACVHGGMVDDGKYWFEAMHKVYGIKPRMKHYGCMVDLLGRAGLLEEARNMVENMPLKPNVVIYGCLLGACERHNDVKVGEWVAERFLELEPGNDGVYVVLSNIYANRDMWDEVERIREVMKQRRLSKIQGYSSVATIN